MKKTNSKSLLSLILCIVLIAAVALNVSGCTNSSNQSQTTTQGSQTTSTQPSVTVLGEGEKSFSFSVFDADNKETCFEIHSDKKTVGEALLDVNLISGDDGEYGLYVKTVNGITADYDKDQTYWAFYVNDEYATTGVDMTDIVDGESYSFKIEK